MRGAWGAHPAENSPGKNRSKARANTWKLDWNWTKREREIQSSLLVRKVALRPQSPADAPGFGAVDAR